MDLKPPSFLSESLSWFNVGRPLRPSDLEGQLVVLEFWSSSCVHCAQTAPVVSQVRDALVDEPLLWVGVHTPKFEWERDDDWVRRSVHRMGITHPVISDSDRVLWRDFQVQGWPTLVLIGPDGVVYGAAAGEPDPGPLEEVLREALAHYRSAADGALADGPIQDLPIRPEAADTGALSYPSKVCATAQRLLIADGGHHQIVRCELDEAGVAREASRYGSGESGSSDGPQGRGRLNDPRGMAVGSGGEVLWVADTGNHCIRRIEMDSGAISTEAGTGQRGLTPMEPGLVEARSVALRSPWDVSWSAERGVLIIAMAGSHQLCIFEPGHGALAVLAGTGDQGRGDGSSDEASFSQPSGVATLGGLLYVADAESSCVRQVDLDAQSVTTLCGGEHFDSGDADGEGDEVRLQCPMGLVADPDRGRLLLADTYNHAIKEVRPDGSVRTLYGDGTPGDALPELAGPDVAMFRAPEGLDVAGDRLFVADTGNHRVVGVDLVTGDCWVVFGG